MRHAAPQGVHRVLRVPQQGDGPDERPRLAQHVERERLLGAPRLRVPELRTHPRGRRLRPLPARVRVHLVVKDDQRHVLVRVQRRVHPGEVRVVRRPVPEERNDRRPRKVAPREPRLREVRARRGRVAEPQRDLEAPGDGPEVLLETPQREQPHLLLGQRRRQRARPERPLDVPPQLAAPLPLRRRRPQRHLRAVLEQRARPAHPARTARTAPLAPVLPVALVGVAERGAAPHRRAPDPVDDLHVVVEELRERTHVSRLGTARA